MFNFIHYILAAILFLGLAACHFENKAAVIDSFDWETELAHKNISYDKVKVFIRAFKKEQKLELWAKNKDEKSYTFIKTYPFCTSSGDLGPKRKEGDRQIPEGFYYIDRFNPNSSFYLSLGINYPNESDKILGDQKRPGNDIFIHGGCASVGCIPITNPMIAELYPLAKKASENGQDRIFVHIFPFNFAQTDISAFVGNNPKYSKLLAFWEGLSEGFWVFENKKTVPRFNVLENGHYQLVK